MKNICIGKTKESRTSWLNSKGCKVNVEGKSISVPKDALGIGGWGAVDGLCTHNGYRWFHPA